MRLDTRSHRIAQVQNTLATRAEGDSPFDQTHPEFAACRAPFAHAHEARDRVVGFSKFASRDRFYDFVPSGSKNLYRSIPYTHNISSRRREKQPL